MIVTYKCLACGGDIEERTEFKLEANIHQAEIHVQHVTPMDAACRLVFEAFTEDRKRVITQMILNARKNVDAILKEQKK